MNREIKNDGVYFECNADQIIEKIEELKKAKVIVIKKSRIELAGHQKEDFVRKLEALIASIKLTENADQKSDMLFREMLL